MIRRLVLAAMLAAPPALAAELPRDVAAFVERRERCDHLRGEDTEGPGRAATARALERACQGSDAELARLKRRHAGNPAVLARLNRYDPEIE